ncbi:tetratricopeptide repeat protein [Clostridium cylindrosporum]|uniref:tetratricopeptide repeat protein n=1 Tax=Clostridium cylindrosporum TaxID=1495 RepID=UPI00137916F2|nr:hypothetical protein [Clostridium cylindrosporum]
MYYNQLYEEAIKEYITFIKSERGWIEDRKTATLRLIDCYSLTDKNEKNIDIILGSFKWCKPDAQVCCRLAEYFINKNQYKDAIFWYKVAFMCIPDKDNRGISAKEYYTWIPAIQLCVCYSHIGEYEAANYYNDLAGNFQPESPKVAHNREFLKGKLDKKLN